MEERKSGEEMQLSLVNVLRLELMEKCNCNKGFEVIYFCKSRSCPDHEKQKYYCLECSHEESKHEHKSIAIVKEIESLHNKW